MLKTVIDFEIIKQFLALKQPDRNDPLYHPYSTFYKFLREECFLEIFNYSKSHDSIFFKELITGRGDAKLSLTEEPIKPYKSDLKDFNPHTFFCIVANSEEEKGDYEKQYGLFIAFQDDYFNKWKRLSLFNEPKNLPVRKNYSGKTFKSWKEFNKYLLPFTDVVIADNYLLSDDSMIESNLKPILLQLDKATPVKYNLTIITFEGIQDLRNPNNKKYKLNGKKEFENLALFVRDNHLKCDLNLILRRDNEKKEHDRGIFMNYLWIDSGDSFNYFDSHNDIITGTKIYFNSLVSTDNFNSAKAALENLTSIVKSMKENYPKTNAFWISNNRLLNHKSLVFK
jgi:hypothetical protein